MKLVRYGEPGCERPGILDAQGNVCDIGDHVADISGGALVSEGLAALAALDPSMLARVEPGRLGPCVGSVGKIICIGLNYSDHAREAGLEPPTEPVIFLKAPSAICGPNDDVVLPPGSRRADWEVELGVVIGKPGNQISPEAASEHVAGYCILNDVSERSYQLKRGGQWTKGKSCDTFCPIGPWLVTQDEVPDPQNLELWLEVDGGRMQHGSTRDMIFPVFKLVSYVSSFMSLQSGDIIATGTPAGVGMGRKPPMFLVDGARMSLGISGLGVQVQNVVSYPGLEP